ncbi:hypothetical protein BD769DRAFT_1455526 [Suillus cothurnatus]|nr:hypothetical protein BD769DRAFT_1455526 [Suillus cothurnatus]
MMRTSYDIHCAKHTGEKRYICPHDDCDYKTHDPALFTRHRKNKHGYVPLALGRGAPPIKGSGEINLSSQPPAQPQLPVQPPPPGTFYQYEFQSMQPQPVQSQPKQPQPIPPRPMQPQPVRPRPTKLRPILPRPVQSQPVQLQPMQSQPIQPQRMQPQLIPPQRMQFYPTPYKPQPTQYQPPPPVYNLSLGVFYDSGDTADDYTMYTGPARAPNGWTEGCMCPELMQRYSSEMLGSEYGSH